MGEAVEHIRGEAVWSSDTMNGDDRPSVVVVLFIALLVVGVCFTIERCSDERERESNFGVGQPNVTSE